MGDYENKLNHMGAQIDADLYHLNQNLATTVELLGTANDQVDDLQRDLIVAKETVARQAEVIANQQTLIDHLQNPQDGED